MKKIIVLSLFLILSACSFDGDPKPVVEPVVKETYPYDMSEGEWNELSIKDKTRLRRDFYFYQKGNTKFVHPDIEVEGEQVNQ
ncbi:MAG: hypothetical protein LBR70_01745 [Lactobacillaceae bacterium]|jgi:hypothetical protein|nr:hypothetical protein [Lactobacillaceae bacterium]